MRQDSIVQLMIAGGEGSGRYPKGSGHDQQMVSKVQSLGDAYVNKYGAKKGFKEQLNNPDYVKGQCYDATQSFITWAQSNYPEHNYKMISGEVPGSTTERPDFHFAIQIDSGHVLDLTRKQFDPKADVIHVSTVKDFKKEFPMGP